MNITVDPAAPSPVFEQLRHQLAVMIRADTLAEGTRLPTIRQLAGDLGVARGTVARAFELLEGDGLIGTRGRRGSFVLSADEHLDHRRGGSDSTTLDRLAADFVRSPVARAYSDPEVVEAVTLALAERARSATDQAGADR